MKSILIKAPATSGNVGPGYDIFAMALHEPYDEVLLSLNDSGSVSIDIEGENQNIPLEPKDNTAGLAILEFLKRKNLSLGVHIKIIKHMCSGGGLGTTGASAAGSVYGLNKLLNLKLSDNELIDIARMGEIASGGSPHADNVAASMIGGFVLIKSYNPMDVLRLEIPDFPVVLANIKKTQRTTRGFITYEIGEEKLKDQMARVARVIHALHTRDIIEFGKAINVDHIHVPVRSAAIPEYKEVHNKVIDAGAFGFTVSGGGSSVIAVCSPDRVDEIADIMEKAFASNPYFVKVIKTRTCNKGVSEIGS